MVDAITACAQIDADRFSRLINGIQKSVSWRDRAVLAETLAGCTNNALPRAPVEMRPELRTRADALKNNGIAYLSRLLSPTQVADIHAHLKNKPCYTGHVATYGDGVARSVEECARLSNCGSYQPEDVLAAPHLLELANSPDLLAIAESYLGCTPTIYSMNLFWSFPDRETRYDATQKFHRDFDDFRFCTVFVFLTEIQLDDGAHYFMRGTHRADFVEQAYHQRLPQPAPVPLDRFFAMAAYDDKDCPNLFAAEIETVTGSAGEAVIEDTYGYHRGDIPKSNRLLGWVRYGLYRNVTAFGDNQRGPAPRALAAGRIPETPRHKFINRLIVEP
jgi:hypothetical protein